MQGFGYICTYKELQASGLRVVLRAKVPLIPPILSYRAPSGGYGSGEIFTSRQDSGPKL